MNRERERKKEKKQTNKQTHEVQIKMCSIVWCNVVYTHTARIYDS